MWLSLLPRPSSGTFLGVRWALWVISPLPSCRSGDRGHNNPYMWLEPLHPSSKSSLILERGPPPTTGVSRKSYEDFQSPVLAISTDDDEYATRLGVQLLHQGLGGHIQFWHIQHNEVPGKLPIRHAGFFFRAFSKTLWPQTLSYLQSGDLPAVESLQPPSPPHEDFRCRL
jgi:hypothetical protein